MAGARVILTAVLLLLTSLGSAAGIGVNGALEVRSNLRIGPSSSGTGSILAAFWSDASDIDDFSLVSDELRVMVYEFERMDTLIVRQSLLNHSRTYGLTDATVSFVGDGSSGWVGLYSTAGGAPAAFTAGPTTVRATEEAIGNADDAADGAAESRFPLYRFETEKPYVLLEGDLGVNHEGALSLKVVGPTVQIQAEENSTTLWTGTRAASNVPGHSISRWLVLVAQAARIDLVSTRGAQIAFEVVQLATEGVVQAEDATGEIRVPDGAYLARGEPATLAGNLTLDLRGDGAAAGVYLRALVAGTLESSTLAMVRAPSAGISGAPFLAGGIILGVAVALGAVAVHHRTTRPRRGDQAGFAADDFSQLADQAADEERFGDAIAWIQKARILAPSSSRLALDEGTFREALGDVDGALACYRDATGLSDAGEGDFLAAVLILRTGGDQNVAAEHVVRAVQRTPTFALEVLDSEAFVPILQFESVARALARAERELGP